MLNKDYYILLSILEKTKKIFRYTSTYKNAEDLYKNDRDFDATMMNFIIIGEEVGKLSEEFKKTQRQIEWAKIYGLRNIIAHHYFGINADLIWQIIQNDLQYFKEQIELILK